MSRLAALALLVGATVVWGATFSVVKGALADAGPFSFLALRFVLAALLLLPALRGGLRRASWSPAVLACGVALFFGYAFQTVGLTSTTPARSAFITALSVVLVPLVEPVFGFARFSARAATGALLALGGLAVLLQPEAEPLRLGDWLTLGCAVAFAGHVLALNAAVRQSTPSRVNALQVFTLAVLALPAAAVEGFRISITLRLGLALLLTSGLATVAAFWAMAAAQRVVTAAETAVVLAFEPVAAAAISVALGEDALSVSLALGGCLVVAGVMLATRASPARVEEDR